VLQPADLMKSRGQSSFLIRLFENMFGTKFRALGTCHCSQRCTCQLTLSGRGLCLSERSYTYFALYKFYQVQCQRDRKVFESVNEKHVLRHAWHAQPAVQTINLSWNQWQIQTRCLGRQSN